MSKFRNTTYYIKKEEYIICMKQDNQYVTKLNCLIQLPRSFIL